MDLEEHVMYQENEILKNRCRNMEQELADIQKELKYCQKSLQDCHVERNDLRRGLDKSIVKCDTLKRLMYDSKKVKEQLAAMDAYNKEVALALKDALKERDELKKLVRKYRRCLFKPYNPQEIDNDEFYEYDRQLQQACTFANTDSKEEDK